MPDTPPDAKSIKLENDHITLLGLADRKYSGQIIMNAFNLDVIESFIADRKKSE